MYTCKKRGGAAVCGSGYDGMHEVELGGLIEPRVHWGEYAPKECRLTTATAQHFNLVIGDASRGCGRGCPNSEAVGAVPAWVDASSSESSLDPGDKNVPGEC